MQKRARRLWEKAQSEALKAEWLWTAPNPRVGAIALRGGHVVGRGFHHHWGGPHAEEMALRDAGAWDQKMERPIPGLVDEMVVTLEPCSSQGKRPPCVRLIQEAQIKSVIVGALDPNPEHQGAGLAALKKSGVQLTALATETDFGLQNPSFLRSLQNPKRPWVYLKWASTVDGKLAAASGQSQWISGPESRAEVHQLRANADAVMVGKGTLKVDRPSLTARTGGPAEDPQPWRVLFDPPASEKALSGIMGAPSPIIWICDSSKPLQPWLRAHDEILITPRQSEGGLDLKSALAGLKGQFQIQKLMVEGGPRLHGEFLALGMVDAVVRYEAPILLGGAISACLGKSFHSPGDALVLSNPCQRTLGRDQRTAWCVPPLA